MEKKLKLLCEKITKETHERLKKQKLDCQCNLDHAVCRYEIGKKYAKINDETSGKYMVELSSGQIYGIKAYGVIHKGHCYGNLNNIDSYFWGEFRALKI